MRASHSAGIRPPLPSADSPTPQQSADDAVPRRRQSLQAPEGLAARGRTGADAIYTTDHLVQLPKQGWLSRLKTRWKTGKTTASASLGPMAAGMQTQHPAGSQNQVQAPRFSGDGTVPLPHATRTGLAQAVQQALQQVEAGAATPEAAGAAGPSMSPRGTAARARYWAQQALSVLAMGKGPASVPGDVLAMLYDAEGLNGDQGAEGSARSERSVLLGHMQGLVHAEKAKAAIHLAAQAALPGGERVGTDGALQRLTEASQAAARRTKNEANALNARRIADLVQGVPAPLQHRLQTAADTLAAALNHGAKVPDVLGVDLLVRTARATLHAERVAVCTNTELGGLLADRIAPHGLRLCQLHMLRVQPPEGFQLPGSVMGDLSLVRYHGYSRLPAARVLRAQLDVEEGESLAHGIHLIVVQSADGSLVVGDSHHYGPVLEPFADTRVDDLILRHLRETLHLPDCRVTHRWLGTYPSSPATDCLIDAPDDATRLVLVTSGTGASTAFGIAEDVFAAW
ncbi:hypothetical protein [Paracidovorax cattleyae]|uniref:hypothetical protein n=1 Tax=Paracidovorax cattleyae TaxID=80868 RepID=UPI003EBF530D